MNEKLHRVIGTDLGTTYSAVAAYDTWAADAEIINDPMCGAPAGATTPSVAWIDPETRKVVVGPDAKRAIAGDPDNTVIEIKREMGALFTAESLASFQAGGMYAIDRPVKVRFGGEWLLPQEISAFILMRMKGIAEAEIGVPVYDAVITVPAHFTEQQKKATEEAALLAGLYPRQLIPEPTAAMICFGVDQGDPDRKIHLVYDLGGGTFDVSIIEAQDEVISVIATSGDRRLGGGDFDDAITRWAMQKLGLDPAADRALARRIKAQAERTKHELSFHEQSQLLLPPMSPGQAPPAPLTLTRDEFVALIEPALRKSLSCVEAAIESAKNEKGVEQGQIDSILLVGGSTKIPRVRAMLLDHFGRDDSFVQSNADPDAVVARGAAMLAPRFAPSGRFEVHNRPDAGLRNTDVDEQVTVNLITEHTLGVGIQDNLVDPLIRQGTNIPVSVMSDNYCNEGPTTDIVVAVYQGEGKFVFENTLIGKVSLGPIEPKERGFHKFEVTFTLDESGLLSVVVKHVNTGNVYPAKFEQKTGVGGDEALVLRRQHLAELYDYGQLVAAPAAPILPSMPSDGLPLPVGHVEPMERAVPTAASNGRPAAEDGATHAVTPPVEERAPAPAGDDLHLGEVPHEFRQTVRRVKKYLLRTSDPDLAAKLRAFAETLRGGGGLDDLEALGDELADAFDDARR